MQEVAVFFDVVKTFMSEDVPGFPKVWQGCVQDNYYLCKSCHLIENSVKIQSSLILASPLLDIAHLWILYSSWI